MKISGPGSPSYITGNYRAVKVNAYQQSQSLLGGDKATLSEEAISFSKAFNEVKEAVGSRSPEDLARMEDIRERVQSGTYYVDSDKIADSILGDLFG